MSFVHLHVHSDYSNIRLLDSTNKIPRMINYVANELGQTALALTDHETVSGHIDFLKTIAKFKKQNKIPQDFKPILGNEIYLVERPKEGEDIEKFYHFILLAKDAKGHMQLRKLSSLAWEDSYSYKGLERVPTYLDNLVEVVQEDRGHLIASTACLGSYFANKVLSYLETKNEAEKLNIHRFITGMLDLFGEDFYIELQPSENEEQIAYNKFALTIAQAYGIKSIITTDAHYLTKEDRPIHKSFLNSSEGDREVDEFYSSTHFFTEDMIHEYMGYLDKSTIREMLDNTLAIADKCEIYDLSHNPYIPKVDIDYQKIGGMPAWESYNRVFDNPKYPYINKFISSSHIEDKFYVACIFAGLEEKRKPDEFDAYLKEIEVELDQVWNISETLKDRWGGYFTTIATMIDVMWKSSIVLPSRGSAACFVTNFLMGIVQIDKLKSPLELPYWRFMSKERADAPKLYWASKVNPLRGVLVA